MTFSPFQTLLGFLGALRIPLFVIIGHLTNRFGHVLFQSVSAG